MSNELVHADPAYRNLMENSRQRQLQELERFPEHRNAETGFAPTYIIARYDGGVGASTLAAMMIPFINKPMIIEVGGNRARALKSVDAEDRLRFTGADGAAFGDAIDARIQCASRTAIIECEQEAYRDAIKATAVLRDSPFHSPASLLLIAADVDRKLKLVELAAQFGIDDPIVFDQHGSGRAKSGDHIRIPTLPKQLQTEIYTNGKSLTHAIQDHQISYTVMLFVTEYAKFGQQVRDRIAS